MRLMATLPAFLLVACALLLPPEASAVTFAGCFEEKSQERVFIQSPGDYDPDLLATEPVVCTSRCQQMSFAYAAIWQSRFCFCSDNINQTADFNITDLAAAACTAPEYVAVYNSEIATSIEDLEVTVGATTEVAVNTPLEVKALNVSAPLSNTFSTRLGYADDRFRKELIMSNGYATNKSYIQPGVFNIKAQAYQYENTVIGSGALQIKVTEPLSGINLTCPSVWITEKQMQCVLSIASGTGLRALINWGDGTTENFIVADPPWDRAGSPVATQNSEMENSSITGALVAADFKFEGTLQAFEFFAHTAGSLELLILRPACSGGTPYYCYSKDICDASNACNSDIDCAATSEILCPATENCWQASGSTCATKATKRNVTRSLHSTFNVAKKYSVSAQVGYNLLPVTDQFLVLPGDKIGFWGSVAIVAARPVSVVEGNDYSFSSVSSPTTLTTSSDLTAQPMQHQISAISRPVTSHRLDRTYSTTGNFTVKVTISNAYLTGVESNASQSVWIQPNINDTRFVPVKYVLAREPCNIALEPHTGVDVKYNWSYSDSSTTESTSVPVSTYSYSSAGPGFINVTAFTVFENKTNSTSFQIIERVNISALVLDGQIFGNDSAATVVLATGTDYNCTFSISPGSTYYVSSNAMRIPPLVNIGYYNVNATCTNFLTSDSRSNVLYVEVPVTTFQLVTKAAEVNVAIQLKFRLNNCTHPKFEALLLNLTRAMTYNEPLLEVDMEPVTIAAVGKYVLISRAYNNVSDVLTVMNFTVQERIAGLNITIDNAVQEIGSVASFKISMTKGSGVQIDLAFGDGNSFNYTTEDIEPWGGRIILPNTTYATGGDYTVTLNASNLLGFEVLTLTVHVIAPLGIYQLVGPSVATLNTPVGFQLQLVVGSPPSLTTANFTWGDGTPISTFNNVQLNVDYNHTYTAVGGYAVSFSAKNPIPSTASNSTSIIVVKPIENPTVLFTPPVLAKGEVARAIVNVDSGTNITITLNPGDGNPAITYWIDSASTSTVVMNATYIINGTFTMNLTICNPYHCFVYTNNLPVVNKLDSGTLGLTNAGNVTFGRPLEFTFTYSGASADAPYGAMIEVRDSSDAVVQNSPVVIPITTLNLFPPVAGYIDYTFFVYNNGSNFTVAGPRIGTFTNITNLNFTLKYRTPGDTKLSSGYGPNQLMFPNKKDLVAVPTSDGYIQGYILSIEPIAVNVSAIKLCVFASNESAFKYIETTGAFEVTLTAWNPMSNATVTMNITVGGSILGGRVVDNDGVTKPKETRSVSLVWDVISDDTCVFVDLGLPQYRYVYGPANCNTTCGSSFDDTYQYTGALVTNNRLDFNVVYDKRGTYQVNVFACNEFTNSSFSGTLAVSNAKCRPPVVVFTDARYSTPDSPREILRSDQAIIECRIIELPCELTLSNKREWYFYKLDPISFGVIGSVNVTALPSSGNTILAVPKLFLDVGLYKVTVRVVMNTSITIEEFANSTSMYLQVGSSPLFIALNNGGMSEVKLTTRRQICLQPKMFSRDPDVNSTSVSNQGIGGWIYHCYQEGEAEPSDNSLTPLQTPKPSSFDFTGSPPAASGCFSSPPGIVSNDGSGVLCFDGRNLLSGRTYIFKVQGTKSGRKGKASIRIQMVDNLPATVVLRCRFLSACRRVASMTDFQIVNPSETVQLSGSCNCSESPSACQSTSWHVKYLNHLNVWVDVDDTTRSQFIEGTSNSEISFSPGLFNSVNSRKYRVCLNVANGTDYDGEGCIQLFTNTMPTAGTCSCNATSGVAGISGFNITCSGYRDDDGIDSYKFFLVKEVNGKTSSLLLGYNHKPHFIGPFPFFSEVVTIQVVVSDVYGATVSNNYTQISLSKPSKAHTDSVIKSILGGSAPLLKTLNKGDMQDTCNELQNIAALVVESSHSEISKLTGDDSVTTAGSGYGDGTTNGERGGGAQKIEALPPDVQAVYQKDRNDRAEVFKKLTTFLTTLTTADAKQVELVAGSMKGITEAMDDLPRSAQIGCKNKAIEMVGTLSHISDSVGKEQMEAIVTPLLTTLSQTMSACSAQVDWGITGDIEESKKSEYYEYDTDWESDRQGFMKSSSTLEAGSKFIKETNGVVQGKVSKEVSSDSIGAIEDLTVMLASKQVQGDKPLVIVTPQLSLVINNTSPDSLSGVQISAGRSSFSMPKGLCELTKASTSSGQCSGPNSAIAMAAFAMPTNPFPKMPTNNGDCSIPKSAEVVTLNLRGKDGKEIRIDNTGNNGVFEININKDPTFVEPKFTDPNPHQPIPRIPEGMEVPGSAEGPFEKNKKIYQKLILHDFQLTGNDQSVHFQVEFENFTRNVTKCRQFLVVGRLWHPPSLMDPEKGFDWWGMIPTNTEYCRVYPGADEPDPFTFFVSNDKFNKVKAKVRSRAPDWDKDVNKVKFGVRELEEEEFNKYTENNPPPIPYPYSKQFTIKYKVRIFSASCYATRRNEDSWSTSGCTVGNKTTVRTTQCLCSHLTSFAGGWVESPNTIDWNYVFSNFDFTKNPTLFVTQIVIAVLFTLIFIWARHGDKKDLEKLGVTPLYDNNPEHKYLYEIVVSTGMRRGAGTESKVHFILSGERDETDIRPLEDKKRKVLQRGCADRFLMAVERPLGALNFLRIWHDNSGRGASASWYCNSVVVIDLQTRRRYHFVLNRWLAVEEDDGVVDRVVPVAGLEELKDFNYMFSTQTKKDLTDGHLWLSIMARPPESRFTRVERVACCLFLLFLTMVTTCMFYQKEGPTKASATSGLNIGPFSLTPRMVWVGVVTNIITFVPLFLVMELFRRSRLRVGYVNQLKKAIDDHFDGSESDDFRYSDQSAKYQVQQPKSSGPTKPMQASIFGSSKQVNVDVDSDEEKPPKRPVRFPWWVRIISWIILILGTLTSAVFTTFYGIQFGDETCKKWISSLFVSFFASVMLSQPLKVLLVAVFFALLCKKQNSNEEEEFLDDEEEVLNEIGKRNGLRFDEEWMYDEGDIDRQRKTGIEPPNAELLERARERRLKEKKMFEILREIVFYFMFYLLLLLVTFAFRDPNLYDMKSQMERLLLPRMDNATGEGIPGISTEAQFWQWLEDQFIPGIRADRWYNGAPPLFQRGYTGDRVGRLVGYAIMRQKRNKLNTCVVQPSVRYLVKNCIDTYNFIDEEKRDFDPKWTDYNPNTTALPQYEAFRYTSGSKLKSFGPYIARMHTYSPGGYVFQFRGSLKNIRSNIAELKTLHWLDKQTRAIFLELAFYNPNVNLFGIATIVFEFEGSGGMVGIYRFQAANLLSFLVSGVKGFEIACQVVFCFILIAYMVKEARKFYKERMKYFTQIWNIAEMFILIGSMASIAAYAYVLYETSQLTSEFKKYGGNVYLNFQYVAFWNEYLTYFTAFIVFVSTLKFVRLLRFNKRMGMLGDVLRVAARDIRQFFFMFFIIFAAFIQTFYLVFMDQLYGYCTFIYTMEQLMQIALGKFKFLDLYIAEPIIGPAIFSAYTIFIIFILLNMFVAILNEAFAKVRDDVEKQENEHEMLDFIVQKVMVSVGMGSSRAARSYFGHNLAESDYRAHSFEEEVGVALPSRIDSLVEFIEKVYFEEAKKKRRRAAAGKTYEVTAEAEEQGSNSDRPKTADSTSTSLAGPADRDLTRIYD